MQSLSDPRYDWTLRDREYPSRLSTYCLPIWLPILKSLSVTTIVELGAFDGMDAVQLYEELRPQNMLVFECNPKVLAVARANLAASGFPIHLKECAAADVDGEASLLHVRWVSATSLFDRARRNLPPATVCHVTTARIERCCRELGIDSIDLLCADIQGAELMALRGCGELLSTIKAAVLEVPKRNSVQVGAPGREEVMAFMDAAGLPFYLAVDENDHEENVLFLRRGGALPEAERRGR